MHKRNIHSFFLKNFPELLYKGCRSLAVLVGVSLIPSESVLASEATAHWQGVRASDMATSCVVQTRFENFSSSGVHFQESSLLISFSELSNDSSPEADKFLVQPSIQTSSLYFDELIKGNTTLSIDFDGTLFPYHFRVTAQSTGSLRKILIEQDNSKSENTRKGFAEVQIKDGQVVSAKILKKHKTLFGFWGTILQDECIQMKPITPIPSDW